MQQQTIKDIQNRVLADSFTIVTTSDEDKLIRELSKLNKPLARNLFFWSSAIGLHQVDYKPHMYVSINHFSTARYTIEKSIKSIHGVPILTGKDLLDEIAEKAIENRKMGTTFEESCYILLDFCHEAYEDGLFRKLKDTAKLANLGCISIIITMPSNYNYSAELLSDVSMHAYLSHPSGEEIGEILLNIDKQIKEHNKVSGPTDNIESSYDKAKVVEALLNLSENKILDILQLSMIFYNNIQHESIEKIKTLWNIKENV